MEEKQKLKLVPVFKALIFAYAITTLLLLLLAFLVYRLELSEGKLDIGIFLIEFLSCLAGGFLIGKTCKVHRFLWGILIGSVYVLILIVIAVLMGKETMDGVANIFVTALICLGSGALGGMLA